MLDGVLNLMIILLSIVLLVDAKDKRLIKLWATFCLFKLFRYLVFYFRFDRKQLKENIIQPCIEYFNDMTTQIVILFMLFSAIGMTFFGGQINSFTILSYNEEMNSQINYEYLNFNSFANSMIFMFVVALNDSWPLLANLCILDKTNADI